MVWMIKEKKEKKKERELPRGHVAYTDRPLPPPPPPQQGKNTKVDKIKEKLLDMVMEELEKENIGEFERGRSSAIIEIKKFIDTL